MADGDDGQALGAAAEIVVVLIGGRSGTVGLRGDDGQTLVEAAAEVVDVTGGDNVRLRWLGGDADDSSGSENW